MKRSTKLVMLASVAFCANAAYVRQICANSLVPRTKGRSKIKVAKGIEGVRSKSQKDRRSKIKVAKGNGWARSKSQKERRSKIKIAKGNEWARSKSQNEMKAPWKRKRYRTESIIEQKSQGVQGFSRQNHPYLQECVKTSWIEALD